MKIIIVFDIPVEYNWLRDKIRNLLKDYGGKFLEYSVYETDIDEKVFEILYERLEKLLHKGGGRIDIVFPCKSCYRKILLIDTTQI